MRMVLGMGMCHNDYGHNPKTLYLNDNPALHRESNKTDSSFSTLQKVDTYSTSISILVRQI